MASTLPTTLTPLRSGSTKESKARVLSNDFGEGYRQLTGDGINMINSNLELQWIGNDTDTAELTDHFEERKGYQTFTINASWISDWGIQSTWKWSCAEWSRTEIGSDLYMVTATMRREFHLV